MAQSEILAALGPFTGLDQKTSPRGLAPGKSVSESGWESYVFTGPLLPMLGRSLLFNNATTGGGSFTIPIVMIAQFATPSVPGNYIIATGPAVTASNGATLASWNGAALAALSFPAGINSPISLVRNQRAVQY